MGYCCALVVVDCVCVDVRCDDFWCYVGFSLVADVLVVLDVQVVAVRDCCDRFDGGAGVGDVVGC